jgi:hypothetical protein
MHCVYTCGHNSRASAQVRMLSVIFSVLCNRQTFWPRVTFDCERSKRLKRTTRHSHRISFGDGSSNVTPSPRLPHVPRCSARSSAQTNVLNYPVFIINSYWNRVTFIQCSGWEWVELQLHALVFLHGLHSELFMILNKCIFICRTIQPVLRLDTVWKNGVRF